MNGILTFNLNILSCICAKLIFKSYDKNKEKFTWHINVNGDNPVAAPNDGVAVVVVAPPFA